MSHQALSSQQFSSCDYCEQHGMYEHAPWLRNPQTHHAIATTEQGRLFNPDNPPLAYSKAEGNAALGPIKQEMRRHQYERMNRHNEAKRAASV